MPRYHKTKTNPYGKKRKYAKGWNKKKTSNPDDEPTPSNPSPTSELSTQPTPSSSQQTDDTEISKPQSSESPQPGPSSFYLPMDCDTT